MIAITGTVTGAAEVVARFESAGAGARERIRAQVQRLGLELLRSVKEDRLTGQSLRVQSGRLRRSINESTVVDGDAITSSVGTNVVYGRFWELGFDGVEQVRAHTRTTAKAVAQVRAHTRTVHQAARPFLQPALAEMRDRVLEQLGAAAKEAV